MTACPHPLLAASKRETNNWVVWPIRMYFFINFVGWYLPGFDQSGTSYSMRPSVLWNIQARARAKINVTINATGDFRRRRSSRLGRGWTTLCKLRTLNYMATVDKRDDNKLLLTNMMIVTQSHTSLSIFFSIDNIFHYWWSTIIIVEHLSTAITLVLLIPMSERAFQMMCINPTLIFIGALITLGP